MSRDLGLLSAAFFTGLGLFTALATWLEKVLEPFGISITDAGIVEGVFILGGILGSIVIPALSDKRARRKPFLVADLLVSAIALMVFRYWRRLRLSRDQRVHSRLLSDVCASDRVASIS